MTANQLSPSSDVSLVVTTDAFLVWSSVVVTHPSLSTRALPSLEDGPPHPCRWRRQRRRRTLSESPAFVPSPSPTASPQSGAQADPPRATHGTNPKITNNIQPSSGTSMPPFGFPLTERQHLQLQHHQAQPQLRPRNPLSFLKSTAARKAAVHLLSGGLAAGFTRFALQPLDTAKTRLQAAKGARFGNTIISTHAASLRVQQFRLRLTVASTVRTVLAGRGLRGLYNGVIPGVIGIIPAAAVYMLVFQSLKAPLTRRVGDRWRNVAIGSAAALGDLAASLVRVPCEVAKQRLQVGVYKSSTDAFLQMLAARDLASLYTGLGAQLMRDIPFAASEFIVYENLKAIALRSSHGSETGELFDGGHGMSRLQSLLVGGSAGVVAALVSNPCDVVKTRLMTQIGTQRRYDGIADAFRRVLADEGPGAFAKGLGPRVAAKALQSACFFATFEFLRQTLASALRVDMKQAEERAHKIVRK